MVSWGEVGREVAGKLEKISDEESIKALALETIKQIKELSQTPAKRENARKSVSREIRKTYPNRQTKAQGYYHDPSGKAELGKWRHLIFKYLKLDSADYDDIGGEHRADWKAQQVQSKSTQQLTLENMTIEQLELDAETTTILENALEQSGMELAQFIKKAIMVYAKTITGKTKLRGEDLANVPTDTLLNDPSFNTHPGRAEELTKRAIQAIKYFNANVATENTDRWCITQSAIAKLTGSKPATIGKILEQYKDEIETHNQTYGLNDYSNRKRDKKIEDLNFTEYVPDGLG
jgi:hypothetical protein